MGEQGHYKVEHVSMRNIKRKIVVTAQRSGRGCPREGWHEKDRQRVEKGVCQITRVGKSRGHVNAGEERYPEAMVAFTVFAVTTD